MPVTVTEITLSHQLRQAQRSLAAWYDSRGGDARRNAFAARAALAALDAADLGRLQRWLAWLAHAQARTGNLSPLPRIHRLDPALGRAVEDAIARLPAAAGAGAAEPVRKLA